MLTELHARRVRSIWWQQRVPLSPMTIIVGPNGAGKSNIIWSIVVASRLTRTLLDEKPNLEHQQSISGNIHAKPFPADEVYAYTTTSRPDIQIELQIASATGGPRGRIKFVYSHEWVKQSTSYKASASAGPLSALLRQVATIKYISTDRLIRPDINATGVDPADADLISGHKLFESLMRISDNPEKAERLTRIGRVHFGVDWKDGLKDPKNLSFVDKAIGPSGVQLPFHLGSLGTRQFFPILVHTLAMEPGGTLLTEEPEISLHPAAQVAAGEHLGAMVAEGIQVLITTHSHYLLLGICKKVREGVLRAGDVTVLNCTKGKFGTEVQQLPIDDSGRVEGWIPSFAAVDEHLFRDWMGSIQEA